MLREFQIVPTFMSLEYFSYNLNSRAVLDFSYRVTRRVVSGRSKQYLLRPETTLLVTQDRNWAEIVIAKVANV